MKKRFLSAALALVMVLTLIPATVVPASAASTTPQSGKDKLTYFDRRDSSKTGVTKAGWYYSYKEDGDTIYVEQTSGIVGTASQTQGSSGTYYDSIMKEGNKLNATNFTLLDSSVGSSVNFNQSATVNLNGNNLTVSTYGDTAKLTFTDPTHNANNRGTVTWSAGTITDAFELSLTNVNMNAGGTLTATGNKRRTISLNNALITGSLDLDGRDQLDNSKQTAQTITDTGGSTITGDIKVNANSSKITLKDTRVQGDIYLTGTSSSLQLNGSTTAKNVYVLGNGGSKSVSGNPPTITVERASTVQTIRGVDSSGTVNPNAEQATGAYSITVYGTVTGAINLRNANITVDGGGVAANGTAAVNITTGTVTVRNSGSRIGNVNLNGKATLDFTNAKNTTVGTITASADATVKIPSEASNSYTALTGAYSSPCINGGAWGDPAPDEKYLSSTLKYALKTSGTYPYVYYTATQLGEAITAQRLGGTLTPRDQTTATGADTEIEFRNGGVKWGTMYANAASEITLPTEINGVKTPTWVDNLDYKTYSGGDKFTLPSTTTKKIILDAQGGGSTDQVSVLTGAMVLTTPGTYSNDLKVTLSGKEILVSGAVATTSATSIWIRLTTDGIDRSTGGPIYVDLELVYSDGSLKFATGQTSNFKKYGIDLETSGGGLTTLMVNKNAYTLRGDLAPRNTRINVVGVDTDYTYAKYQAVNTKERFIEVNVTASRYTTPDQKDEVIRQIKTAIAGDFDWTQSPAMKQAVNAALRSVTDPNVISWADSAKRAAWTAADRAAYNDNNGNSTGYDTVLLVPFLQVNVSDYQKGSSITMNLVPSYRIEVVQSAYYNNGAAGGTTNRFTMKDDKGALKPFYVVPNSTRALSLSGDLREEAQATYGILTGGIKITFPLTDFGAAASTLFVHQDSTYDYLDTTTHGEFMFTHAGNNGTLGSVTINTTEPQIKLYANNTKVGNPVYFSSLQAAVDETKEGNYIEVAQNFSGNKTVNVTGLARQFSIQANGNDIVIANASGGLVDYNTTGKEYTVKLNRTTAISTGSKTNITIDSATGGSASATPNPAKTGDTVTVTLTPSSGYISSGVSVKDSSGKAVTVSGSGNSYTFTMPSGTATVTPSFTRTAATTNAYISVAGASRGSGTAVTSAGSSAVAPGTTVVVTTSPANGQRSMNLSVTGTTATRTGVNTFTFTVPSGYSTVTVTPQFDTNNGTMFSDVWSTEYYSDAVFWAVSHNPQVTNGNGSDYIFSPDNGCTREQMITFLYRAAGSPAVTGTNSFWDVSPSQYYYNAVLWAASKGITNGNGNANTFGVGQTVTRAEAMTWLYRYNGSPAASSAQIFGDVPTGQWYTKAINWAYNKGVTNGNGNGTASFGPNQTLTRAQAMTFLYRDFTGTRA